MKKFLALIMTLLIAFSCLGGVGCRGAAGSDDPQDLEIYCYVAGYGTSWLEGVMEAFEQEEWVKEKYPELTLILDSDSVSSNATNRLSNQKTNSLDLYFGAYNIDKLGSALVEDLTTNVYLTEVPGGNGELIIDMLPQIVKDSLYQLGAGTVQHEGQGYDKYYGMKYAFANFQYMYNKTLFDEYAEVYGWQVPVTTEEFLNICNDIRNGGGYDYMYNGQKTHSNDPIIISAGKGNGGYTQDQFVMYWAQYEGKESWENFFDGIHDGEYSPLITTQKGRLRSLEMSEEILQNYSYPHYGDEFLDVQGRFLAGCGMFHWNGDYFTTEMQLFRDALPEPHYEIQTLPCPVVSSIVERLDFYKDAVGVYTAGPAAYNGNELPYDTFKDQAVPYKTLSQADQEKYDAVLAALIREIDAGMTYEECSKVYNGFEVTKHDYDIVYAARLIKGNRSLGGQVAVVPTSTPAKELAFDFLRYFYSENGVDAFATASKGLSLPLYYYENMTDEEYEEKTAHFTPEAKSKYDMMYGKSETYKSPWEALPDATQYLLGKVGLTELASYNGNMNLDFLSKSASRSTSVMIFEKDIKYWTEGDTFEMHLARAGL